MGKDDTHRSGGLFKWTKQKLSTQIPATSLQDTTSWAHVVFQIESNKQEFTTAEELGNTKTPSVIVQGEKQLFSTISGWRKDIWVSLGPASFVNTAQTEV